MACVVGRTSVDIGGSDESNMAEYTKCSNNINKIFRSQNYRDFHELQNKFTKEIEKIGERHKKNAEFITYEGKLPSFFPIKEFGEITHLRTEDLIETAKTQYNDDLAYITNLEAIHEIYANAHGTLLKAAGELQELYHGNSNKSASVDAVNNHLESYITSKKALDDKISEITETSLRKETSEPNRKGADKALMFTSDKVIYLERIKIILDDCLSTYENIGPKLKF